MTIFSFRRVATVTATCYVDNLTSQAVAGAGGVEVTMPVHVHAVMAGGAQAEGRQAGGIGYLDLTGFDDAFPAAAAACG